jgi:shikimate kinase
MTARNSIRNLILCGFMGTGKSTVGHILADRLGWRFVDTDALIEAREGRAVTDIFAQDGEPAFRALERAVCEEIAKGGEWQNTVIGTGGGMVIDPVNRDLLGSVGLLACLDAPADVIAERLRGDTFRPLLSAPDPVLRISELLAIRREAYGAIPHHVDTSTRTPEQVADAILDLWKNHHAE